MQADNVPIENREVTQQPDPCSGDQVKFTKKYRGSDHHSL